MDMRVSNAYSAYKIYSSSGSKPHHKVGSANLEKRDAFTLSVQAEDYQQVRNTLAQLPDIRQDQVNAIRARIESGQYNIGATAIADKIIQNVYG